MNAIARPDDRLFRLARSGRRVTHPILAVVLAFVFLIVGALIGELLATLVLGVLPLGDAPLESAIALDIRLILGFLPIALLVWGWIALYERRSFASLGFTRPHAASHYALGLAVGVLLFAAALAVAAVLGDLTTEPGAAGRTGLIALGGVLVVYLGWALQGATEEIVTRGWLLQTLGVRLAPWAGIVGSSAVFAIMHGLNPGVTALAVVNLFLFGAFAALYALWEGGLWGVAALHAAWNWAEGNLFGLDVSGMQAGGAVLLDFRATGPDSITGGQFGPEGGLMVTVVLVVGIAVLAALRVR